MHNQLPSRQEQILTLLLSTKSGLSIDAMAEKLAISRNAVQQHLSGLESQSLIQATYLNSTGGRPARNYVLTEKGINHFTKQYSWFCNLVLEEMKHEMGSEAFSAFMQRLGRKIAASLEGQFFGQNANEKAQTLTAIMHKLGYQADIEQQGDTVTISAINCVFHDLAQQHTELCEFDRALIGHLLDNPVEQVECMAKDGCSCRFVTKT
ncbi:helix-turn-helix transcriptional regulator [Methylomarinum vadi]|uniref:helix-turn-helix transcriptional regulator n=1 Tax=Methylomarinum vadi TaxID=438855 RepID=UPI0004DF7351|nr:HTH domain-containing protein [Methylomarinum vadi]